jgi:SAM-dependent methyltransferase
MAQPDARSSKASDSDPRAWLEERVHAFRDMSVLVAAFDLGLADCLSPSRSAEELAIALQIPESRRLEPLLDSLCWLGILAESEGSYGLTELGGRILKGPERLAPELAAFRSTARPWLGLADALRSPGPRQADPWPTWGTPAESEPFADRTRASAQGVAAALEPHHSPAGLLVDVGCGSGAFARAFLERHPQLRALLLDRAPMVNSARSALVAEGLAQRVEAWAGDVADHPPGLGADLVLVSNVFHAYGPQPAERLVLDALALLRPGGTIAIRDLLIQRSGEGPRVGTDYALGMALFAPAGGVYPVSMVRRWLSSAGLSEVEELQVADDPACYLLVAKTTG